MTFKDDSLQNSLAKNHSNQNPYIQVPYSYKVIHLIFYFFFFFCLIFFQKINLFFQVHLILNLQMKVVILLMVVVQVINCFFLLDMKLYYLLVLEHFLLTFEEHLFKENYQLTLYQHNYAFLKVRLTQLFFNVFF